MRGESSAMDGVVGPIKAYLKKRDPATIDNFAFKLHYRVTFVVMLVCMMLVTARYIYTYLHISTNIYIYLHIYNNIYAGSLSATRSAVSRTECRAAHWTSTAGYTPPSACPAGQTQQLFTNIFVHIYKYFL